MPGIEISRSALVNDASDMSSTELGGRLEADGGESHGAAAKLCSTAEFCD